MASVDMGKMNGGYGDQGHNAQRQIVKEAQ